MFRHIALFTFSVLVTLSGAVFANTAEKPSPVDNFTGHEYVLPGAKVHYVESDIVGDTYELRVSLPGAYYSNPEADFPVAYVLDGQWGFTMVSDINGKLGYDGMIPGMIVVAITWAGENVDYNLKRQRDFTHTANPFMPASGGAVNFLAAIEQEIIPFVDIVYRTNDQRTLMGASLGGLFSTYAMLETPKLFSGHIALSAPYSLEQAYFDQKIAELSGSRAVALRGDKVVGYGDVQADGYIDHFFVHGAHQRQGVGAALMQTLLKQEKPRYYSNVSDTAKGFFEFYGFAVLKRQQVLLNGVTLHNSYMERFKGL